jgi:hypothetical protein
VLGDIIVRSEVKNKKSSGKVYCIVECSTIYLCLSAIDNCFQIVHGKHVITLRAPNIGSKINWVREINKAKQHFQEAEERLRGN